MVNVNKVLTSTEPPYVVRERIIEAMDRHPGEPLHISARHASTQEEVSLQVVFRTRPERTSAAGKTPEGEEVIVLLGKPGEPRGHAVIVMGTS